MVVAVIVLMALTAALLFTRPLLGEAVIAMLYLLTVGWFTSHAGPLPGLSAAVAASILFAFFFIPPFFTFAVGSVEGWLMLVIFVLVAVLLVDRFQAGLARARAREQEARWLAELSLALVGRASRAALAAAMAEGLQQLYQAAQVQVLFFAEGEAPAITAQAPDQLPPPARPSHVVPMVAARRMIGEIRLWNAPGLAPAEAGQVLERVAGQVTLALERMGAES